MRKQFPIAAAVLAVGLFGLSGCGESSDTCRFDLQRDLDDGNFDAVIAELSSPNSTCRAEYPGNNYYLDLAAAYMGKAGVSVSDFVKIAIESGSTGDDAFKSFINNIDAKTDTASLNRLASAKNSISDFNNGTDLNCSIAAQAKYSYFIKDACLYKGMIGTVNASVTVSTLTTNIQAWLDENVTDKADDVNNNDVPDDMDAASCALNYAVDKNLTCKDDMTVTVKASPVTFKDADGASVNTYESIEITVLGTQPGYSNRNFNKLISGTAGEDNASVAITDGNCTTAAFAECSSADGITCFVCPVNQEVNGSNITMTDTIVDGLNNTDSILGSIDQDSDMYKDVEKIKAKIDKNGDGVITREEVVEYLQNN